MKEIQELIKELQTVAERCDIDDNYDINDAAEDIREIANNLEKAVIPCNQLKMREALLKVKKLFDDKIMFQHDIRKAHEAVNDALSAPPLYATEDEAYQAYLKEMEGTPEDKKVFFETWLFNKLKGV